MLTNCPICGEQFSQDELGGSCPACLIALAPQNVALEDVAPQDVMTEENAIAQTTELTRDKLTSPALSSSPAKSSRGRLPHLPGFKISREIARGGMGIVYEAIQENLQRTVAVKVLRSGQDASEIERERFQQEALAAGRLQHPNIVPIFDIGEYEDQPYFSMAFVRGTSLDELLQKNGKQRPRYAAELLLKLTKAVETAHRHGIVHRDLKPGNVLIDERGEPQIADFGLAKRLEEGQDLTMTGQALGTPSYMAPEQAAGKKEATHPAVDIYALGGILYAMLTGRPPFVAASAWAVVTQVLQQEPTWPSTIASDVDPTLEAICLRCLEKDPKSRYSDAKELSNDLDSYLNGRPVVGVRIGRWATFRQWLRVARRQQSSRLTSKTKVGRLPLVSIAWGPDATTDEEFGRAFGVIAIGDRATGVFAYGEKAYGLFAFGRVAVGGFCFGLQACGICACGLVSIGLVSFGGLALGGVACGFFATGWIATGFVALGFKVYGAIPVRI